MFLEDLKHQQSKSYTEVINMFLKIELNSLTLFKVQFSILDCSLDNNEIKKQLPNGFFSKKTTTTHQRSKYVDIHSSSAMSKRSGNHTKIRSFQK